MSLLWSKELIDISLPLTLTSFGKKGANKEKHAEAQKLTKLIEMRNTLSLFDVFLNENSPCPGDMGVFGLSEFCSPWSIPTRLFVAISVFTSNGVLSVVPIAI